MNRQSDPKTSAVETAPEGAVLPEAAKPGRGKRLATALAGFICFGVALTIYVLRLDRTVGMFVDDAWYVLLAKAIATGHGFTAINSPSPGILPLYPPGFPALLSIVFRFFPEFPGNLWMLKSVSIAAMMGVGIVTFWYFHRAREVPSYLALAIATVVMIIPPMTFLAASTVMSEPVFTLSFMLAIALVERATQVVGDRRAILQYLIPGAIIASYAFLTRSIGIALIGSAILYLLKLRQFRSAVTFAGVVVVCIAPWMIYSRIHAPTAEQRAEQSGFIMQDYRTQFWQRKAGLSRAGEISISELPERMWNNASQMMTRDAGEMIVAEVYYIFQEAGSGAKAVSFLIGLLCIAGYIVAVREKMTLAEIAVPVTLVIILMWPWETFRFVLPVAALAVYYFLLGLRSIFHIHLRLREQPRRPEWVGLTVLAGMVIVFNIYGNVRYLRLKHKAGGEPVGLMKAFAENETVLSFINERLPDNGVIASINPPLIHLYTGRKTVASDQPEKNWQTWNRVGVRYLAYISAVPVAEPDLAETRYTVVYKPRGDLNLRIVDLGPPETRPTWGTPLPSRLNMIN